MFLILSSGICSVWINMVYRYSSIKGKFYIFGGKRE
jgi:hypothetical protein